MYKIDRFIVHPLFMLDTNRINAKEKLPNMNKLEKWKKDGVINIIMSEVANREAKNGNNFKRAEKAGEQIFSLTCEMTPDENKILYKIKNIIFPKGPKDQSEKNDVEIVFNAYKYGCFLITDEGASKKQPRGILGSKIELSEIGIQVMRDSEAVNLVENKIEERDRLAIEYSKMTNTPLPKWVGQD